MSVKVLLITPPFTQLNTPYPATAYLKGFLNAQGIEAHQCDLSIELFNRVFKREKIEQIFNFAKKSEKPHYTLVWNQRNDYISKVDRVIAYLRNSTVTEAYQMIHEEFLPRSHRWKDEEEEFDWAFGDMGVLDKAKYFCTLFVEELGDFIRANTDEFFAFTRYAEQLALTASSFDQIEEYMGSDTSLIEEELFNLVDEKLKLFNPDLVGFSIPFPGNLFAGLRCSQYVRKSFPSVKIAFGGGYCNTELRSLNDPRIFQYIDFITLDSGEGPLLKLTEFIAGKCKREDLLRTFLLEDEKVSFVDSKTEVHTDDIPSPSYIDLPNDQYISFLDVMNPMHRLWSDGRWNKLTLAHGCYWAQCSFCDTSLDYIKNYKPADVSRLVDKIEEIITETGSYGFHFVDEAAPPKLLKALAEELISRKIYITWWTNIRFERTFTPVFCSLLAKSGCIAVTGGLEVASDRLLAKMNKGVDIIQVARVTSAFTQNNIMVHAYLMYGFPTQTAQETVDSLEIVRQLFENGCIQSAFWHHFSATSHSPIGKNPGDYGIRITGPEFAGFADNDLFHEDPQGTDHQKFAKGLNLALQNYMNGVGFDISLQDWFDFKVKPTKHAPDYIADNLI